MHSSPSWATETWRIWRRNFNTNNATWRHRPCHKSWFKFSWTICQRSKFSIKKNRDSMTTLAKAVSLDSTSTSSQDMMKIVSFAHTLFCNVRWKPFAVNDTTTTTTTTFSSTTSKEHWSDVVLLIGGNGYARGTGVEGSIILFIVENGLIHI